MTEITSIAIDEHVDDVMTAETQDPEELINNRAKTLGIDEDTHMMQKHQKVLTDISSTASTPSSVSYRAIRE